MIPIVYTTDPYGFAEALGIPVFEVAPHRSPLDIDHLPDAGVTPGVRNPATGPLGIIAK